MSSRYTNRELSLLDFQERVLALAEQTNLPLLERVKFLAIVSQNVDEFFQVRVSGLKEQQAAGYGGKSADGLTTTETLAAISERIAAITARRDQLFTKDLLPEFESAGISLTDYEALDRPAQEALDEIFEDRIFPVLTPLAIDPAHPFPWISDLSLNLAVQIVGENGLQLARVKVPPILPRFIVLPDRKRFVPLEQVIAAHLQRLFPGLQIVAHHPFRVTRTADPAIEEEEAQDLLAAVESALRTQQRSARAVRLEVHPTISDEVLQLLLNELQLMTEDVSYCDAPLDLGGLWALTELDRPGLKIAPWTPVTQPRLAGEAVDFFSEMAKGGDILVHLPYESFATSAGAFLAQAAEDPDVLAIKQTLYRTSMPDDPAMGGEETIVRSLIGAAEAGKQVVVLVELKARGDEQANIRWARLLEEAGVHVVYGVVGLKTHSKVLLVARNEGGRIRRYSHIGTGNYNPKTATIYEDLGLFTTDAKIGSDLSELFNVLTGFGHRDKYRNLWVAPTTLRPKLLKRIAEQAARGPDGSIVIKLNHLIDTGLIDALYKASQAGTEIDLIIRATCGLRPGVKGLSENIRVRSIVGQFLEHSRIYRFGRPGEDAIYRIGSADLMPRNLDGRVEAVAPVKDPSLQMRLEEILEVLLADDVLSWQLTSEGSWEKVPTVAGVNTHQVLQDRATARAEGR